MDAIDVSREMLTLVGKGPLGDHRWPPAPVAFEIDFGNPIRFRFHRKAERRPLELRGSEVRLLLIVSSDACDRVLGSALKLGDDQSYFLPADLRSIALAIRDCELPIAAATPYRLAKSIELLCEILSAQGAGRLTACSGPATLSQVDMLRIATARQIIDEQWSEKLTLDWIARRCGLNRSKLSRGFREMYRCSVSEALAERRLAEAQRQLIATDLPISLIGYRSGYLNNASFARAFGRRFGQSPTDFRACAVVA